MRITRPLHNRIALAFDFDETLAESSVEVVAQVMGIDPDVWRTNYREPLDDLTWDSILARAYALIVAGRDVGRPLSREVLREAASRIELYDEVCLMPERIRAAAQEVAPGVEVDFTVLSCGYVDIVEHTAVAGCFDRIWGSSFHFDDNDEAVFLKRSLTHPDKARYLEALSKGLDIQDGSSSPAGTTQAMKDEDKAVPPNQMIFVGDGASDLQAFQYVEANGGIAIAVRQRGGFAGAKRMHARQRPTNLVPASYAAGGEMMRSLTLAVQSIASRIVLSRLGQESG